MQGVGVFVISAFITVMFFQNCSQVAVSDLTLADKQEQARIIRVGAGEVVVEVGASQYEKTESEFTVGSIAVPNLKQFWIVDNSGTMEVNNLNLANSFGAMFDQQNQDSLYKFDTTAYLFSTAQTIPSFKTSTTNQAFIYDIVNRQNDYFAMTNITESIFDLKLRTATQNFGLLPGDNVGYSVKKINNSNTDFAIKAAPVLTKKLSGANVLLTSLINKPAKTDTSAFETEFKGKLAVLQSARVPTTVSNGIYYQQSAQAIDKESGLCAVARILDDPNSMYTASDLLAFTIVTDENENDVSGKNCLKRTAYQQQNVDLVNGACWEYQTPVKYTVTTSTPNATYCTVAGKNGYEAAFDYKVYSAGISYRILDQAGGTKYKTPQTLVEWTTPKSKTQLTETPITYYLKQGVAATFKYRQRTTKISYYTKSCVATRLDGIDVTKCTVDTGLKFVSPVGDHYVAGGTCKASGIAALPANAITALGNGITGSQYLPTCEVAAFPTTYTVVSCGAVSADCDVQQDTAAYNKAVLQEVKWVTGDVRSTCAATAQANIPGVIVAAEAPVINSMHFPTCGTPKANDKQCVPNTDPVNCKSVSDGTANGSEIKKGLYSGSTQCTQFVPSGSTFVRCSKYSEDLSGDGHCPTGDSAYGCTETTTTDSFTTSSMQTVVDIKDRVGCEAWVNSQSNPKKRVVNPATDITCTFNAPETRYIQSTRLFNQTSDGGTTLAVGASCGSSAVAFYNAIASAADRSKVTQENCKISAINGSSSQRPYLGLSCEAQKADDCNALGFRLNTCSSYAVGGGATPITSAALLDGNVPMSLPTTACSALCSSLVGACDDSANSTGATVEQYLRKKYAGVGKTINCAIDTPVSKTNIKTITAGVYSDRAHFCPASMTGIPRYFVQAGGTYRADAYIDNFVTGDKTDGATIVPAKDLITYINDKVEQEQLNVNFTMFIRKTGDPLPDNAAASGIDYVGKHYEALADLRGGQKYSVAAESYGDALTNLSAVIKSKLIRSFTVSGMKPYQVITDVTIIRSGGSQALAIGSWSQAGNSITIDKAIPFTEGDRVVVKFQNDDGYVKAQLKKIFILDEMRPDQIIVSVEQIKATGETVLLRTDQWLKSDNTVSIAASVVINGGDQFRIKFKNNTDEQ